jgi:hypothetical protein
MNTKTTPKDFFLWAGAMISLFGSIGAFIGLVFDYINYAFPDPLVYYASNPYENGVAFEMSIFIILGALCLVLMRVIHRTIEKDSTRADIWVRRWALYLTLFIAGASIAVDLITLLTSFLNGEAITMAFLLKVVVVLCVAAIGFMHFLADLWGYWTKNPKLSMRVTIGVAILGILTIAAGFLILGTPYHARQLRYDQSKIDDLGSIQSEVLSYWTSTGKLPQSLDAITDPLNGYRAPTDSQSGAAYEYKATGTNSFQLCATFNQVGSTNSYDRYSAPAGYVGDNQYANWQHGAGHVCFDRTIDPARYPVKPNTPKPTPTIID